MCLLERIAQLGSETKAAGDRRRAVQRLEEVSRQEEAYQMASKMGPAQKSASQLWYLAYPLLRSKSMFLTHRAVGMFRKSQEEL